MPGGGGFLIAQAGRLVGNEPGFFHLNDILDDLHGSDGSQVIRIAPGEEDCSIGNLRDVQAKIAGKTAHSGGAEVRVHEGNPEIHSPVDELPVATRHGKDNFTAGRSCGKTGAEPAVIPECHPRCHATR